MRETSWRRYGKETQEVEMTERVYGQGHTTTDALQSLLDNMEVRCEDIRLELRKLRGERP